MKRIFLVFFPVFLLFSCNDSPFLDPAFERCVDIAKQSLHINKYGELKILVCDNLQISQIEGIQEMPLLETIKLRDNLIRDIGPLAELKKLKHLELQDNYLTIESIEVLSQLTTLEYVNLDDNCINGTVEKEQEIFDKIHASNPNIEIDAGMLSMKSAEECQ